jgi:hypothetical protein
LGEKLSQKYHSIQWQAVMAACDVETFLVPDQEGWKAIKEFWTAVGDAMPFPITPFISHRWRNLKGQLSFLLFAITEVSTSHHLWLHCTARRSQMKSMFTTFAGMWCADTSTTYLLSRLVKERLSALAQHTNVALHNYKAV